MDLEWDETKRLKNIAKHGLDFLDAVRVFAGPHLTIAARPTDGERRQMSIGLNLGRVVTIIHSERGTVRRIISMRSTDYAERNRYYQLFGG